MIPSSKSARPLSPSDPSAADHTSVRVTARDPSGLVHALLSANASVHLRGADQVEIRGMTATQVAVAGAALLLDLVDLETISASPAVCGRVGRASGVTSSAPC